jgi:methylamine---glutamate N-methyltransferase subunit C
MPAKKIDFGPLQHLIGTWKGDKGMDVAPAKPTGKQTAQKRLPTEEAPYFEEIKIEAVGDVTNAEEETLVVVRYHQSVYRKSNKQQFHDEIGYWIWNPANKTVMQSLMIPRAVGLLAGGKVTESRGSITFKVGAGVENKNWGIVQSPFMRKKARTLQFSHTVTVKGNSMTYTESTKLEIYGKTFNHTDGNTLTRR